MTLRLGVLDQSPIISGHTPTEALRETIALAQHAEALGYSRYWLAEHHAIAALVDPCPEILVAAVAAATSRIRVGTGGVLLPYYSPLKTAEVFRMLEALHPGRIDLGVGRLDTTDNVIDLTTGTVKLRAIFTCVSRTSPALLTFVPSRRPVLCSLIAAIRGRPSHISPTIELIRMLRQLLGSMPVP